MFPFSSYSSYDFVAYDLVSENQFVAPRIYYQKNKPITMLLPTPNDWFIFCFFRSRSASDTDNLVCEEVVSGRSFYTYNVIDIKKLFSCDYDSKSDSVATESQPLVIVSLNYEMKHISSTRCKRKCLTDVSNHVRFSGAGNWRRCAYRNPLYEK